PELRQFLRNLLVENFLYGERDDDGVVGFEETVYFAQRVIAVIKGDEKAFVAFATPHGGFKGVNVGTAGLVLLFDLNRIPAFLQTKFAFLQRHRFSTDGENAAINSKIADFGFVRDAAEGDDGPVLKFKRRNFAQLGFRPRQVAHDEAASDFPEFLVFRQTADIAESFGHDPASGGRNINANPLPFQILRRHERCAASAKGIKNNVIFVAAHFK